MTRLGGPFLNPVTVFTTLGSAEVLFRATSTHQWKLMLGNAILGSEVCGLEGRIPGNARKLVQLEFGNLGGNEREEDEERGEVLHGHLVVIKGGQERTGERLVTELKDQD